MRTRRSGSRFVGARRTPLRFDRLSHRVAAEVSCRPRFVSPPRHTALRARGHTDVRGRFRSAHRGYGARFRRQDPRRAGPGGHFFDDVVLGNLGLAQREHRRHRLGSPPGDEAKKYPAPFATAIFAAAGGVSTLVPPAIDLIIIGVVANISIGGLFAAGVLPAAVNGLAIMALAYYFARKLNLPLEPRIAWREKLRICSKGVLPILMVVIILGGIYGGIFTPTEASAVAVVYGFVVSFFVYKELELVDLPKILLRTCSLTGVVLLILGTASLFSFVLTFERIPHLLAELITEHASNWIVFLLMVHVVFLLLGMIMDALPPIIVLMPILVPAGVALGIEPIHLGILVAANVGIGMISPPVGICLYVSCGISGTPIEAVVRPLIPFLAILIATLLLISYVPVITMFLPTLLGYVGN
ncbi:MAG: TRAP transporter large permease [Acidobacteria bacterium]|nr:MAG: TRAP transporter large permease [Acidobacteriota bacterium]